MKWALGRRNKGLLAAVGAVLVLAGSGCSVHRPASVSIMVAGKQEHVPSGTTVARAASLFGIKPASGSLLDVSGKMLRRRAFPGSLLVDGRRVPGATRLRDGNRVDAVPGRTRTETLSRQLVSSRGGALGDPEFTLARTPGVDVIVRGAVSHELVSVPFQPSTRRPTVGCSA